MTTKSNAAFTFKASISATSTKHLVQRERQKHAQQESVYFIKKVENQQFTKTLKIVNMQSGQAKHIANMLPCRQDVFNIQFATFTNTE